MLWLLPIGVLAGILTTVTGVGGGMVALSLLSLVMEPAAALAISAAAFAVGNTHRAVLFARSVDRGVTIRFSAGLAVGAIAGALAVPHMPAEVLRAALICVAVIALGKAVTTQLKKWRHQLAGHLAARRRLSTEPVEGVPSVDAEPALATGAAAAVGRAWPTSHLIFAGVVIGAIGAGAGGAGVLVSPVLLSAGLRRDAYVATVAACAIVLNTSRVVGYGLGGLYHVPMLLSIVAISVALVAGNLIGKRMRQHISPALLDRIELGTPVVAIALALLGA
jgi:uncharacterized membrane protein YfcA